MDVPFDVPPGITLERDLSTADWLTERLLPLAADGPVLVGNLVPAGFEAYVRIAHPDDEAGSTEAGSRRAATRLVGELGPRTSSTNRCRFCPWVGYGFLGGGWAELVAVGQGRRGWMRRRTMARRCRRRAAAASDRLRQLP